MQLRFLQADIANSRKAAPAVADITRVGAVVLLDCGREFSLADEKIHTLQHRNFHFSSADYLSSFESSVRSRSGAIQPTGEQVYQIWEAWGGWKMTVSWTKSYFEDGRLVRQEHGGWSTGWVNFYERYKSPSEVPAIWKDFGGKPFEGIRGVIADFKFPEGFNPADWNLVAHVTTKDGASILTQPFVASMTAGNRGVLSFTQREQTVWESSM
jgi:hypothetical protein